MSTLLIRLAGPMQSWGLQSHFGVRDTGREPSKSGVIGLLCAALGRPRHAALEDLAALRMGVRVDREGRLAMDYHTAQNVLKAGGGTKDTEVSRRYYLADAVFLAGLEGEPTLLESLQRALQNPVWPLYLGRRAFATAAPPWLRDGLRPDEMLEISLQTYDFLGRGEDELPERLRLVLEDPLGNEVRPDQPLSFDPRHFLNRRVRITFIDLPPMPQEAS